MEEILTVYKGPSYYDEAVLCFFKALKVYPAPMELLSIYQKAVPEPVFQTIVTIVTIEVSIKRQRKKVCTLFIDFFCIAKGNGRSTHGNT
jgi:hypothetical protein